MLDYQNIIDFITQLMYLLAPISIAFALVEKFTNFFISFIRGDRRVKI